MGGRPLKRPGNAENLMRILIIETHDDFAETLAVRLRTRAGVDVRRLSRFIDVAGLAKWNPTVALVATELLSLTSSANRLRTKLPSLGYVVGMASTGIPNALELTCNRVVTKPFDIDAVLEHVERHFAALRSKQTTRRRSKSEKTRFESRPSGFD